MKNLLFILPIFILFSCRKDKLVNYCDVNTFPTLDKINGGSILLTQNLSFNTNTPDIITRTYANWISFNPLTEISRPNSIGPLVFIKKYKLEAIKNILQNSSTNSSHHVMLKPLTSFTQVDGSDFWGDFYVSSEREWREIEHTYEELMIEMAKLSLNYPQVKLLCIGNELREFVVRRPQFFTLLIQKIRAIAPQLKLTYAANWDEFQKVSFWKDLDYIGINSYFPLVNKKTPTVEELKEALISYNKQLNNLACIYSKPILFTEFGYRSTDYGAWKGWKLGEILATNTPNYEVQKNGYQAFFESFWYEPWVAGGFFWEWTHVNNNSSYPYVSPYNNGWSVNNKKAQAVIKKWYE